MERHSQLGQEGQQHRSEGQLREQQRGHQPLSAYPPHISHASAAKPAVQIPFSDPFQNRDPFLPSAHNRRASYSIATVTAGAPVNSRTYDERAWSAQPQAPSDQTQHHRPPPPPPPPAQQSESPATTGSTHHMSQAYEDARRRSVGGAVSPPRYSAPAAGHSSAQALADALPPPPPPPSFTSRTMPPPSPTSGHQSSTLFPLPAPRPPSGPAFSGARDLPSFTSRPGPSMSISSLIGGDSSRHGNHSPRTNATAPSPTIRPLHSASPQRARSASIRTEHTHYGRATSPSNVYAPRADPKHATLPVARPPPEPQSMVAQHPSAYAPPHVAGFRPYQSSPSSAHAEELARHATTAPPRPNSQPMHQPLEHELRQRQDMYDRSQYNPSFRPFAEPALRASAVPQGPQPGPSDRREEMREPSMNGYGPHTAHHRMSPHLSQAPRSTPGPGLQPAHREGYNPPSHEEQHTALFRPSYPVHTSQHPGGVHNGHRDEAEYRDHRSELQFGRSLPRNTPPASEAGRYEAASRRPPMGHAQQASHPYETHPYEQHVRRDTDPLHHRSLLDVSADMARKNGRSSPLPQAVQGAQPRHVGPTAEPGIKNEFGRMFPGLGLGVGSNTPIAGTSANGSAAPSRMSPVVHEDSQGTPVLEVDKTSTTSRSNKRSRKPRDDVGKDDGEGTEGAITPSQNQQQSKRAKTTHTAHHHHHIAHHHHHHHHHPEEQVAVGPSPFNTLRFPTNPAPSQQPPAHHHHHHHTVQPHHHHHASKPVPSPKQSEILVSNQAVLSSIAHRPRKHLGTELYKTRLSVPPRDSTPLDARLHFKSQMRPMPLFENKENCTFTIRVPRGYLTSITRSQDEQKAMAGGLEEICKTRAVWGTDIYSDDSDVVAAAVHSGWLLGDFGEFNQDLEALFREEDGPGPTATVGALVTEKPRIPLRPAPDADLHLTLLILPALTHYTATTKHHLRSRDWAADHDGMSFMIHSMQFMRESATSRLSERTAAAKHQRISDDLKRRNEAAESLLGLLNGGRSVRAY